MEPERVTSASAPGKVILFGEHAVVYGEPSLSLALDRRIHVQARRAQTTSVNGEPLDPQRHAYIDRAIDLASDHGAVALTTRSELPSSGGVGSSAALSVAVVAAVGSLSGRVVGPEGIARRAFEAEYATQGSASPNDTSVAAAGGAVLLAPALRADQEFLWRIGKGERAWAVHRVHLPELPLVVVNTGSRSRTTEQVARVRRFIERNAFGRDVIAEIGRVTMEGVEALKDGDLRRTGSLMTRNHELLHMLGVDSPQLSRLCDLARRVPGTYGAKLTGAGGGGSLIVLTEDRDAVLAAVAKEGVTSFAAKASRTGVEVTG